MNVELTKGAPQLAHERIDLLGVLVSAINLMLACEIIDDWLKRRVKTYVCVAPVATLVECQRNPDYKNVVNQAGMVTPDGMPLVWLGKCAGNKTIERTYGPDLMLKLCGFGESRGYKHFFLGSLPQVCEQLERNLRQQFPELKVVGKISPPFEDSVQLQEAAVLEKINQQDPDILWVSLGSPKQDFWMVRHRPLLNVPVMIGIGAAFDFLSGAKPQAPRWMQRAGLEWLFRLGSEPRRLWKRYLIGNSLFIFYLLKNIFKK